MKPLLPLFFLSILVIVLTLPLKTLFSQYDYVLGQKIGLDDIEPPDNYELQVFMEEDEAIKSILKGCDEVLIDRISLSPEKKQLLKNRLKAEINEDSFDIFIGKKEGKIDKYAIITDEMGCFHPITFIMGMKPDGKINDLAILIYRESRGKEVTRSRFLHQYNGKSVNDPIRLNKDIINITGATTSVRGINRGVRKMLVVLDEFYLHDLQGSTPVPYSQIITLANGSSRKEAQTTYSQASFAMGDVLEIVITGATEEMAAMAFKEAFKEVDRLEDMLSKDLKISELYRINRKAWKGPIQCSDEITNIIRLSMDYSELTNGSFDITEGYLIDKLQKDDKKLTKTDYIKSLFNAASYKNIVIDTKSDASKTIFFKEKLTGIDLSLVSKGYVVDRVIEILKNNGVSHALVNFGGNIRTMGKSPENTLWKIAVPNPKDTGKGMGFLKISDAAVAISGDHEKTLIKNREGYSHIAAPDVQRPFDTNLLDAIVIAPTAFEADTIAAAVLLSGLNHNMELLKKIPNVEGIDLYNDADNNITIEMSNGIGAYFVQEEAPLSIQRKRPACAF